MKILLIDNYDSFTYNIVELLRQICGIDFFILKNDKLHAVRDSDFDKVIISPGPATPHESGDLMSFIARFYQFKPMLGICLGHQAIAEFLGAQLINLEIPYHGYRTKIKVCVGERLFSKIPMSSFYVGLYHSWVVNKNSVPENIVVTSFSEDGHIMSLKHNQYDLYGVQFHPESYMSEFGRELIEGFLF